MILPRRRRCHKVVFFPSKFLRIVGNIFQINRQEGTGMSVYCQGSGFGQGS